LVFGSRAGGAIRWFRLGPLSFQPSELAKFALVVYLAALLARKAEKVKQLWGGFLPPLIVTSILMAMLLKQPDLGTAAIFGFVALAMLFVAGTRTSYIILSILLAAPVVWKAIVGTPWRMRRMVAFLDPWAHRRGAGYQVVESQISIGSGGLFGQGLGQGRQKLFFLPEAHTDFIGSIIGEELGFVGIVLLVCAFALVIIRGFRAAFRAENEHASLLAVGLTTFIGTSAFANLAVAMGLLPTKGLVLPFISYGGSSLLVCAGAMGIVLSVSRHAQRADEAVNASAAAANASLELAGFPRGKERGGSRDEIDAADDMVVAREVGMAAASEGSRIARASAVRGLRGVTT